jgi:hypothetical protein
MNKVLFKPRIFIVNENAACHGIFIFYEIKLSNKEIPEQKKDNFVL